MIRELAFWISIGVNIYFVTNQAERKLSFYYAQQKYYQDGKANYFKACLYGADYPDDWRNYDGPGWNTRSRNTWCQIARDDFEEVLQIETDKLGKIENERVKEEEWSEEETEQ